VVTLTDTPYGPLTAIYVEANDPYAANREFAASTDPFDLRFKQELSVLYPPTVDFSQPVQGVTEIFDSLALRRA
jgi:hypothetical protein